MVLLCVSPLGDLINKSYTVSFQHPEESFRPRFPEILHCKSQRALLLRPESQVSPPLITAKIMKISPTAILATTILWVGTLIGAYQLGHRQQGADSSASRTNTKTSGSRVAEGFHDEYSGPACEHKRASEKTLSVKQLFMQLKAIIRPA